MLHLNWIKYTHTHTLKCKPNSEKNKIYIYLTYIYISIYIYIYISHPYLQGSLHGSKATPPKHMASSLVSAIGLPSLVEDYGHGRWSM